MFLQKLFFKKVFKLEPPKVLENRCLPGKFKLFTCDKCQRKCPQGAVVARRGRVFISPSECSGCNICAAVCPGEAFRPGNLDYYHRFQNIVEFTHPVIGCYENTDGVNVAFTCLFSLPRDFLYSLFLKLAGQQGTLTFDFSRCVGCENFRFYPSFLLSLSKAHKFCRDLGLDIPTSAVYHSDALSPAPRYYTRREVLQFFRKDTINVVQGMAGDIVPGDKSDLSQCRRMLLAQLNNYGDWQVRAKTPLPFAVMRINEGCNLCGLCVKCCIANALVLDTSIENGAAPHVTQKHIRHRPWRCVDCGLCRCVCPRGVLKKTAYAGEINGLLKAWALYSSTNV